MQRETLRMVRRRIGLAVAFARSVKPRTLPSREALYADAALAAAVLAANLVVDHGEKTVPLVVASAPLAARRRWPLAACLLVVIGVLTTSYHGDDKPIAVATIVFAGYSAVKYSRFRGAALVTVPWLWVIGGTTLFGTVALLVLVMLALTVTVGYAVHAVSDRDRVLAEHEAATRRALELERARIASELHDVVTHSVSVMIVQAGAARQVLTESPGEARTALLAVEASGRAAMTELRRLLGLLSPAQGVGGEAGAPDGTVTAELEPQPGLAQLAALVDRLTAAGLPIDLGVGELPVELSPGLDLAVFRVIQESLTNVLKHAGKPPTTVSLNCVDGQLVVVVADTGRPIQAAAPAVPAGAGRGLIGLRERIALYGGVLDAGPRSGGGWIVRACFPVDSLPLSNGSPAHARGEGLVAATGDK
jgi:signal transduction histidine kinase